MLGELGNYRPRWTASTSEELSPSPRRTLLVKPTCSLLIGTAFVKTKSCDPEVLHGRVRVRER